MRSIPHIAPGVQVSTISSADGLRYRLRPVERGGGIVLPPRTFSAVLLMDGTRDLATLLGELADLGLKLGDPARLIEMVRMFEAAGVVDVVHRFTSPGPLRHSCDPMGAALLSVWRDRSDEDAMRPMVELFTAPDPPGEE